MEDNIYREQLMELFKNPAYRGHLNNATLTLNANNPMCGDELIITLAIKDGVIKDYRYDGEACAVSLASAEILGEQIIGEPITKLISLTKEELLKLLGVQLTTSRVKCALLPLETLKDASTQL
ncbi:MAG: iron-sulfur cluster assembly scaffold protein [Patescibacteria group bacterium]|uniref:Iron-sulfur cluster assembly scaffold protein n=1 Tax=candidate division WWE3 bacterium TaxID=2053526 RepID=A0A955EEF8_UNCKA|nr:iron-sulfur cluster assembly scaffold protein [candidate division WWE3 bacterium]